MSYKYNKLCKKNESLLETIEELEIKTEIFENFDYKTEAKNINDVPDWWIFKTIRMKDFPNINLKYNPTTGLIFELRNINDDSIPFLMGHYNKDTSVFTKNIPNFVIEWCEKSGVSYII